MKVSKVQIKPKIHIVEKTIAENFKIIRKIKGLNLAEVGKVLGCTGQQVQKYESGKSKISIKMITKFANFTNLPISFLFQKIDWQNLISINKD